MKKTLFKLSCLCERLKHLHGAKYFYQGFPEQHETLHNNRKIPTAAGILGNFKALLIISSFKRMHTFWESLMLLNKEPKTCFSLMFESFDVTQINVLMEGN